MLFKWWDPHACPCSCVMTLDIVVSVSYYVESHNAITIYYMLHFLPKVRLVVRAGRGGGEVDSSLET